MTGRTRTLALFVVVALGVGLRGVGLFRDLSHAWAVHPDEAKQVVALHAYLGDRRPWAGHDHPAFRGYPFGLTKLDAVVLSEVVVPVRHAVTARPFRWTKLGLYEAARWLRFVYGTLALAITVALFACVVPGWGAVVGAFLLATSPVSMAVTHSGAADVGVDLALAGVLVAVVLATRRRAARGMGAGGMGAAAAFVAGACVGLGAAAKYHAVVLLGVPGLVVLGAWREGLGVTAFRLVLLLAGALVGFAALTPDAWSDPVGMAGILREQFAFVRDFGATPEVLRLDGLARLRHALVTNLPRVLPGFGWGLLLLGAAGAGLVVLDAKRGVEPRQRFGVLLLASVLASFPLLVFFSATKVVLQPFHVSFVAVFLALLAGEGVRRLGARERPGGVRVAAAAVVVGAVVAHGFAVEREVFFWSRPDVTVAAREVASGFLAPTAVFRVGRVEDGSTFRRFHLEGDNAAVFRNLATAVERDDAEAWHDLGLVPTPAVPVSDHSAWVFARGLTLMRSDRYVAVRDPHERSLHLVDHASAGSGADDSPRGVDSTEVLLGFRTGPRGVEVHVEVGGHAHVLRMPPHHQTTWRASPRRWRTERGAGPDGVDVRLVPVRIRPVYGSIVVAFLTTEADRARFEAFGGGALEPLATMVRGHAASEVASLTEALAFVAGEVERPEVVPHGGLPLEVKAPIPAGRWIVELSMALPVGGALVDLDVAPTHGGAPAPDDPPQLPAEGGLGSFTFRYWKRLAPLGGDLSVRCETRGGVPGCVLLSWSLRPDVEAIVSDLHAFRDRGVRPPWASGEGLASEGAAEGTAAPVAGVRTRTNR